MRAFFLDQAIDASSLKKETVTLMRINKFFTENGICSRREADRFIEEGRVQINGQVAKLGDQVEDGDQVTLNGKPVRVETKKVYIMFNKPPGVICTTDHGIKGNIVDAVNHPLRVYNIGRLDRDSKGLILLTNDGSIVNKILRAQFGHEKEYIVATMSPVSDEFLFKMARGVDIGNHVTKPCTVKRLNPSTFAMILTEGKNRQIRRMCEALGAKVRHLQRVRIMNIKLGDLPEGKWKDIPEKDLSTLLKILEKVPSDNDRNLDVEE